MIGETISHYKILEKLGEGGMGVVYKAHDTKLNRDVAIKFLPQAISKAGVERERFLQEAQAVAALNHPNICVIFEINDDAEQPYIVMEYVDGSTIRTKLENGPFKLDDAVKYGIQIGEALNEAHSKGIVHRDIKADNIIINSKGQAKVMDFGLAKLKGSMKLTRTSSTVGTLGYMAPEQIQGGEVDTRSDIFAFAVLFFEMLTGKLPFRGEHEAAMIYSIVNEDPEPIQKYLPEISGEIVHILGKALEKNPDDRYQHIQDLAVDLRRSKKDSTRVSRTVNPVYKPESKTAHAVGQTKSGMSSNAKLIGSVAGGLVLLAAAYFIFFSTTVTINPDRKFRRLDIPFTQVSYPSISADGKWIAFAAADIRGAWDVYYMHVDENEPKRVTFDSSEFIQQSSDISPDGSKIVYNVVDRSKLKVVARVVSVLGGTEKQVAERARLVRWRPDGKRIGYVQFNNPQNAKYSLWSVEPDGSDNKLEFADTVTLDGRFSFCWAPDGNSIAWLRTFKGSYQELITKDLVSGSERQLTHDKANIDDVCWLTNGMILFSTNRNGNSNLWMISSTGGTPQQVTSGTNTDLGISASTGGQTVLYYQAQQIGKIWIGNITSGTSKQITFEDKQIDDVSLDPTGSKIAYVGYTTEGAISSGNELFVMNRDGSNRQQITKGDHIITKIHWSPNAAYIGFLEQPLKYSSDSTDLTILDLSNPVSPYRSIHNVSGFRWIDNSTLTIHIRGTAQNSLYHLETEKSELLYEDSTNATLVDGKKMMAYVDLRNGKGGFYIRSMQYLAHPGQYPPKLFLTAEVLRSMIVSNSQDQYIYWGNIHNQFFRKSFSSGKIEKISGDFRGLQASQLFVMTFNDHEFAYAAHQVSGKYVLIEKLFK